MMIISGADPGFQVRGGALKKIAPSRGRRENFWGISCEKSRFYAKKSYFFPILGGGAHRVRPPSWIRPCISCHWPYQFCVSLHLRNDNSKKGTTARLNETRFGPKKKSSPIYLGPRNLDTFWCTGWAWNFQIIFRCASIHGRAGFILYIILLSNIYLFLTKNVLIFTRVLYITHCVMSRHNCHSYVSLLQYVNL